MSVRIGEMSFAEQLTLELATRSTLLVVLESSILIILDLLAVSGNLLVCCVAYKTRQSQKVAKILIASLASTDLLVSVLVMPLSASAMISGHWILGHSTCVFHGFCMVAFATASMHTLGLISINRYVRVVKPTYFRRIFTVRKTILYVVVVWLLASLGSTPPLLFGREDYAFQAGKVLCLYPFELTIAYTLFLDIIFILLPMVVMVFCYSCVFKAVRATNSQVSFPMARRGNRVALVANIKETKITKTLAVVVLGFAMCWLPVGVIDGIDTSRGSPTLPRQVYLFYGYMALLSSTINPFIYGMMNRKFRKEYKKIMFCKSKKAAACEIPCRVAAGTPAASNAAREASAAR